MIKALGGKRPSRETSNREATVVGVVVWSVVAGLEQGRAVSTLRMIGGGGLGVLGIVAVAAKHRAGPCFQDGQIQSWSTPAF